MAAQPEFSAEGVRQFILEKGGKVTNQQLVKHFKVYLTNTENKDKAKKQFKEFVNSVASIKKIDKEKYLVLHDKDDARRGVHLDTPSFSPTPPHSLRSSSTSLETLDSLNNEESQQYDRVASPPSSLSPMHHSQSSPDLPTLARYPSDGVDGASDISTPLESLDTNEVINKATPVAPPRRKSTKENKKPRAPELPQDENQPNNSEAAPRISVKEQAQKLNKIASESQINIRPNAGKKRERLEKGIDDDDTSSVTTLDPRARTWQLKAAQADYQELVKLLREEPKLAKNKTALHWGAKHGNADIIKLIAGSHRVDVNIRSGYTALHLAAMHHHKDVYDLLVQTYHANEEIRDYSGKKPRQYLYPKDPTTSRPGNQRKDVEEADKPVSSKKISRSSSHHHSFIRDIRPRITLRASTRKARPMTSTSHRNTSEKDLSFLRFGSINVKVRKTAEALAGRCEGTLWKGWGSAESIPDATEDQGMPPPKSLPPSRRNRPKTTLSTNSGSLESLPSLDAGSHGQ